jgi:hypothetical protein
MAKQVNWAKNWKHQNYTGLTKSQITAKKVKFKAKALIKIKRRLSALKGKFALKSIKWTKERTGPVYYLLVYLKPPAKLVPKKTKNGSGGHGGTGSQVTPTPPTGP